MELRCTLHAALRPAVRPNRLVLSRRRAHQRIVAFGGDPYEPLEKAINVINKILTAADPKNKSSSKSTGRRERWVQFGAVASSQLSLQDLTPENVELNRDLTTTLLEEYLSLPAEEYSLLDPKWVTRDDSSSGNSFRVSIPLADMLGVDLTPEVSIEARPDPRRGKVTLVGSRAALGSPNLDDMFKLNLVVVMSSRRKRRRPELPDHLPGRPVMRLRQWAARARGKRWSASSGDSDGDNSNASTSVLDAELDMDSEMRNYADDDDDFDTIDVNDPSSTAPFPMQKIYISKSNKLSSSTEDLGLTAFSDQEEPASGYFEESESDVVQNGTAESDSSVVSISSEEDTTESSESVAEQQQRGAVPVLDCKVHVTMAIKVPGPLRVVPNALLGYAGSILSRTVMKAALPNFLTLLSSDFKDWAKGGRKRSNEGLAVSDGSSVGLFTPIVEIEAENKS